MFWECILDVCLQTLMAELWTLSMSGNGTAVKWSLRNSNWASVVPLYVNQYRACSECTDLLKSNQLGRNMSVVPWSLINICLSYSQVKFMVDTLENVEKEVYVLIFMLEKEKQINKQVNKMGMAETIQETLCICLICRWYVISRSHVAESISTFLKMSSGFVFF